MRALPQVHRFPIAVKLAMLVLGLFVFTGIFAPYLANDKPVYLKIGDKTWWPIWSETKMVTDADGNSILCEYEPLQEVSDAYAIWPLVQFKPGKANISGQPYPPPGTVNKGRIHYLGANDVGEDTMAAAIHGARISLQVGFASATLLLFIGLLFGVLAAYVGNDSIRLNIPQILIIAISLPVGWFYAFQVRQYTLADAIGTHFGLFLWELILSMLLFAAILALALYFCIKVLKRLKLPRYHIPFDKLVGRFMDFFSSLPRLIILVSITAIAEPSMYTIVLVIGFTGWVSVARYTRAEILKLKYSDFMSACKVMAMSHSRIVLHHLLPNAMGPALVSFTFGVAGAILAEAALSYLGIGIPQNVVTWGKLLAEAKYNFNAWWLIWVPGGLIFVVLLSLNTTGEYFRKRVNPALQES